MTSETQYLKCTSNGRVFLYTELLANRDDMIPCDVNGNIAEGHIADAGTSGVERVRTNYLGNPVNGVLFPFTDILAQREDLVSVNTPEEWEAFMKTREGNAQIEVLEGGQTAEAAPVLGRDAPAPITEGNFPGEIINTEGAAADALDYEKGAETEITGVVVDEAHEAEADVSHETIATDPAHQLPELEGLNATESKTALSEWAEKYHGTKLDRRPKLQVVLDEAKQLLVAAG